jgi:hypothetical protein
MKMGQNIFYIETMQHSSISLQTAFSADSHQTERQVLREEPTAKKEKSLKFRVGTRMSTVSSKEGQNLKPL